MYEMKHQVYLLKFELSSFISLRQKYTSTISVVQTISFGHRPNHRPLNNGTLSIRRKTASTFYYQRLCH